MPDGITLAADAWMPEADGRFPVVFDYYPYRKNDNPDSAYVGHRYLAERGIVAARIDVRGTGDSEGTAEDEYCPQEQLDGVAAIAWLAEQPWSNGRVGMFGTSYGGFNTLQVAMHRPPALKAICPMYFTDRRYTDDCHYKGGAMQMLYDVGTYGLSMVGDNLLPPHPELVGEKWAAIWEQHLQNEPWLLRWVEHQTEDEQWKQGSLCENYEAIQAATYLFGGWRDGYTNCNLRAFEHLRCPKKVLVGPWLHVSPYSGIPGPRINHFRVMARFYLHWLADIDTGIMDEPPITIYIQEYDQPRMDRPTTSGFWRFETEWPLERGVARTLYLGDGTLGDSQSEVPGVATIEYNPTVGSTFGIFSAGGPPLVPGDQRIDEGFCAVYTAPPLEAPVEILGYPTAVVNMSSTADGANVVVRLCDVAPDGQVALVTKGVLNVTHRESHEHPTPIEPGTTYELTIQLDATSWVFAPGHRVRLTVSNADFPNTWPSPQPATTRVLHGPDHRSRLVLPVVPADARGLPAPILEAPPTGSSQGLPLVPRQWRIVRDPVAGTAELTIGSEAKTRLDERNVLETSSTATAAVSERNPAYASMAGEQMVRYRWPIGEIQMNSRATIASDPTTFQVTIHAEITVDGCPHFSKAWTRSFPRRLL
jgi:predicted acyl esterase